MMETPSAAFLQSSRETRSPASNSTFFPAGNRPSTSFNRFSWLEGRTKHRRLERPYSRRVSRTFTPMKPFDPVTKMRSPDEAIYAKYITELRKNGAVKAEVSYESS